MSNKNLSELRRLFVDFDDGVSVAWSRPTSDVRLRRVQSDERPTRHIANQQQRSTRLLPRLKHRTDLDVELYRWTVDHTRWSATRLSVVSRLQSCDLVQHGRQRWLTSICRM